MATNIYESCTNPITGETFKCISVTTEAYTMQWMVKPHGYVPFEHIHYHQDEIFFVQKGELRVLIDGKEHIAGSGEKIVVPMGVRHTALNNRDEEMEAIVEYRPGLDQDRFTQCLTGLINDGYIEKNGGPSIPMMGYFLRKMNCKAMARPTNIPAPAFKIALNVFYLMGTLRGWNKLYTKYTE